MKDFQPAYLELFESGELKARIERLSGLLKNCELCPRECRVNRTNSELGYCQAGKELTISSAFPHFGEEPPLTGINGSGTIFITHCNLRCTFCQNYEISHYGEGTIVSERELADIMIGLQKKGCHNINFVTPTHYIPQIVQAVYSAIDNGLNIPLVYNCGGFESLTVIKLLAGIFDIYMPDIKFSDEIYAVKYMNAEYYFNNIKNVLKEMHRQVGDLQIDRNGIGQQGLIIRHLVLPQSIQGSRNVFEFIAKSLSVNCYLNIMSQYHPCFGAVTDDIIFRRPTSKEYQTALTIAGEFGLSRGF